jgi:integrase
MKEVPGVATPRAPERYADPAEIAAFLRFAWRRAATLTPIYRRFERKYVLLVRAAMHAGCRPAELATAEWSDFQSEKGRIVLPASKWKSGGKTGRSRTIYLTPRLVRALLREQARPDRHPTHLFSHKRGPGGRGRGATKQQGEPWLKKALTRHTRNMRALAIAAKVPVEDVGDNRFVLYRLRHTRASDALMAGMDLASVAELLGTSPRMLETTYGHLLDEHLAEKAAEMAAKRRRK